MWAGMMPWAATFRPNTLCVLLAVDSSTLRHRVRLHNKTSTSESVVPPETNIPGLALHTWHCDVPLLSVERILSFFPIHSANFRHTFEAATFSFAVLLSCVIAPAWPTFHGNDSMRIRDVFGRGLNPCNAVQMSKSRSNRSISARCKVKGTM
jgi:hypothetical protein